MKNSDEWEWDFLSSDDEDEKELEVNINKYQTKHFGEITVYDFGGLREPPVAREVRYKDHSMFISFERKVFDDCLKLLDDYPRLDAAAKTAVLDNFAKSRKLKTYFKSCFENFDEKIRAEVFGADEYGNINADLVIKNLITDSVHFDLKRKNNELTITLVYHVTDKCTFGRSHILSVKLDESLNLLRFEHGECLLD